MYEMSDSKSIIDDKSSFYSCSSNKSGILNEYIIMENLEIMNTKISIDTSFFDESKQQKCFNKFEYEKNKTEDKQLESQIEELNYEYQIINTEIAVSEYYTNSIFDLENDCYNSIKSKLSNLIYNKVAHKFKSAYEQIDKKYSFIGSFHHLKKYNKKLNLKAKDIGYKRSKILVKSLEIDNESITISSIFHLFSEYFNLNLTLLILANMYIDKIGNKYELHFNESLIKGMLIGTIIISIKFYSDCSINFIKLSTLINLDTVKVKELEFLILSLLDYKLFINQFEFDQYLTNAFY